jgi:serine carboxypeptidase-like clade I
MWPLAFTALMYMALAATTATATAPPPKRFEVKSLPGWVGTDGDTPAALPSKMWTGYLDAGPPPTGKGTMYFHYWLVESERDPANDPVLIWYNGGPGASSLFGLLQEWGPLRLLETSYDQRYNRTGVPTPQFNPYRWTKTHTVVAIDSPPPMGLSFCSEAGPQGNATSCGPWTDKSVFAANHEAHRYFFDEAFPELKSNPVYLTGESYAGIYLPGFADAMMTDPVCNFKGWAIGDGWTGCVPVEGKPANWCIDLDNVGLFKYPNVEPGPYYDVEFFHGHSQFSNSLYREIQSTCTEAQLKGTDDMPEACQSLIQQMADEVGLFFAYNLYNACPSGAMATKQQRMDKHGMNRALRQRRQWLNFFGNKGGDASGVSSPCLGSAMNDWFLLPETLEAIGAPYNSSFINLDNGHGFDYTSDQTFVGPIYERAIKEGLSILVYEGDVDACGLQTSNVEDVFVPLFDGIMNKTQKWRPWTADGYRKMGGYVVEWAHRNAQFVSVRGSGHLVPLNRPHVSQVMIEKFTSGQPLPAVNVDPPPHTDL